uniref:Solute carrier family 16 member 13 n=1 Tax=Salarias fasciatus TaxID=181472 RepID=A0A672I2F8_SALFA
MKHNAAIKVLIRRNEGPDGGWGWVLVAALFISTSLVFGLMRSLGIFFVEFVQYFEESAHAISWISSIGLASQQFFSPLGAALCNAYNTRLVVMAGGLLAGLGFILASQATSVFHLYLTMGVVSGEFRMGLDLQPMVATVMAAFTRRRALALGLAFSSIGLSSFAFNPLFLLLVERYAWRGVSSYLELSLLLERPYLTFALGVSLFNMGYFVPYFHLVAHSRQAGFSEYQAAFVMSAAGITDILGRVASGCLWTFLAGVFIMLLPVSSLTGSYAALMTVALFYGFTSGALTSLVFAVLPAIVGVERVMGALGLLQLIERLAPGLLKDTTGSYVASFLVAGAFLILGTLTMATLPHFFSCKNPLPPPNRRGSAADKESSLHPELEQMNDLTSDPNQRGLE